VGIVTKCDIASAEQLVRARKYLEMAGARTIFFTSSIDGAGFEELLPHLGMERPENQS